MSKLLQGEGAWIALGVSALFIVAGLVMHRVFVNILKRGSDDSAKDLVNETSHHATQESSRHD